MGRLLAPGSVVCFFGDLGAGKTTLIKGIVLGVTAIPIDQVSSPTFVYLNIYEGDCPVYHFDLYRLRDSEEFVSMGFDEFLSLTGVCCIEWSERIESLLPKNVISVTMEHAGDGRRKITVQ